MEFGRNISKKAVRYLPKLLFITLLVVFAVASAFFSSETISYLAQGEEQYSVVYNLNEGTNDSNNPLLYTAGETVIFLPATREGYTFRGWSSDQDAFVEKLGIGEEETGVVTVYAFWVRITYKVTFYKEDGISEPEEKVVEYGGTYPTVELPTKTGYTFRGYYTARQGGTLVYSEDGTWKSNDVLDEDKKLYAHWTEGRVVYISTKEELISISSTVSNAGGNSWNGVTFELRNDIDMSTEQDFVPIGTNERYFEGKFYGFGHSITLGIKRTDSITGLFGYTGSNSVIDGLVIKGKVEGTNTVGGLVAQTDGTLIRNCTCQAEVVGSNVVGGLVGKNGGKILSCAVVGNIYGKTRFGGIVGESRGTKSSIEGNVCCSKLTATGSNPELFGGIVGVLEGKFANNCFYGTFDGTIRNCGYLIGKLDSVSYGVTNGFALYENGSIGNVVGVYTVTASLPTLSVKSKYNFLNKDIVFSECDLVYCKFLTGFGFLPCPSYLLTDDLSEFRTEYQGISSFFKLPLFESGDGSVGSPFILGDVTEWYLFVTNSKLYTYEGKVIRLKKSLLLNHIGSASSEAVPFKGTVNGQNYTLQFSINATSEASGLFSYIEGATISDLTLKCSVSSTQNKTGVLAGQAKGGTINNVKILPTTTLLSAKEVVGGFVGLVTDDISFTDCQIEGSIVGQSKTGGFVGEGNGNITITNALSQANISSSIAGATAIGGLIGKMNASLTIDIAEVASTIDAKRANNIGGFVGEQNSSANVQNITSRTTVSGRTNVGGVFGIIDSSSAVTIRFFSIDSNLTANNYVGGIFGTAVKGSVGVENGYYLGQETEDTSVTREGSFLVSVIGKSTSPATLSVASVYYDSDECSLVSNEGAVPKSTVDLTNGDISIFTDGEWQTVTQGYLGGYYPVLACFEKQDYYISYFDGGEGTSLKPLRLANERQIINFVELVNKYPLLLNDEGTPFTRMEYQQTSDILLTRPLTSVDSFEGMFDGQNHLLQNLTVSSSEEKVGLFATLIGTVKNICLDGGNVTATTSAPLYVGSLVGYAGEGKIIGCYSTVTVTSSSGTVGGLVGYAVYTESETLCIENSFFAGNISANGSACVGGIVGCLHFGRVTECFTTGVYEGNQTLGGVVGRLQKGIVVRCQTNAVLKNGASSVGAILGGLVGWSENIAEGSSTDQGQIMGCISLARLLYDDDYVQAGGLVGKEEFITTKICGDDNVAFDDESGYYNNYYFSDFASGAYDRGNDTTVSHAITVKKGFSDGTIRTKIESIGYTDEGLDTYHGYNAKYDAQYLYRLPYFVALSKKNAFVKKYSLLGCESRFWQYNYFDTTNEKGSKLNPYQIDVATGLSALSDTTKFYTYTGTYFIVTKDLNMIETEGFYPIGHYTESGSGSYYFDGTIDGNYKTIQNLTLNYYSYRVVQGRENESEGRYVALFGYVGQNFSLSKLILDDTCTITGTNYVASFVGFFQGTLNECWSEAKLLSYVKTTVREYEQNKYYYLNGGTFSLDNNATFEAGRDYYTVGDNIGGLVGALRSSGASLTGCVFSGTLPTGANTSYGFVGASGTQYTLNTANSWFVTKLNRDVGVSYDRILFDDNDILNDTCLTVQVVNHKDGKGFGFQLLTAVELDSDNREYRSFLFYGEDSLQRAENDLYYLSSSELIKYSVRYCQPVEVSVEDNDGAFAGLVPKLEQKFDIGGTEYNYYYIGQTVAVTLDWAQDGYYLRPTIKVNGQLKDLNSMTGNFSQGAGTAIVYTFEMTQSRAEYDTTKNEIVFYVREITDADAKIDGVFEGANELTVGASGSLGEYNGQTKTVRVTVGEDFESVLLYTNGKGEQKEGMLSSDTYTVAVNIRWKNSQVTIGRLSATYVIGKKKITVQGLSSDASVATTEYLEGSNTRTKQLGASFISGVEGSDSISVSVTVTWAQENIGEGIQYTLSNFVLTGTDAQNYYFDETIEGGVIYTNGIITKKTVTIEIASATQLGDKYIFQRVYNGTSPLKPSDTDNYPGNVVWNYQKCLDDFSVDMAWNGKFGVGYYTMTPSSANTNYIILSAQTYYLSIVRYSVTTYSLEHDTLIFDNTDLSKKITSYHNGVGDDGTIPVELKYYTTVDTPISAQVGSYYVKGQTSFTLASEFNAQNKYYVLLDGTLTDAGTYYVEAKTKGSNYVLASDIVTLTILPAEASIEMTYSFSTDISGVPVDSNYDLYYADKLWLTFTDDLSNQSYYVVQQYSVQYVSRPKGGEIKLMFDETEQKWFLKPVAYADSITFRIVASGIKNFKNRTSVQEFMINIKPNTLYVGIKDITQTFGNKISYEMVYSTTEDFSSVVSAETIDGLIAPTVSTGGISVSKVGTYDLIYSGGYSLGYKFDMTKRTKLTVQKKHIYVYVDETVVNGKMYGEKDETIKYRIFSDEGCTQELIYLENGIKVEPKGTLAREQGENVGAYAILQNNIGEGDPDYQVTFIPSKGQYVVYQRDIVLEIVVGQGKKYGEADQTYLLAVSSSSENTTSLANGDMITLFTSGASPLIKITREEGEDVGYYEYIVTMNTLLAKESNYNIIEVVHEDSYAVSRAVPVLSFEMTQTVYYGDTANDLSIGGAVATCNGKPIDGTFSWQNTSFSSLYPTSALLIFTPADGKNYKGCEKKFTVVPQKRIVYPEIVGKTQYVYDGTKHSDIQIKLGNLVAGQNSYNLSYSTIVGDNRNVTKEGFSYKVTFSSEYYVLTEDFSGEVHCEIIPAVVTVKIEDIIAEYGATVTPVITYEGFVAGENETELTTKPTVGEIPTEPGNYSLIASGATSNNYTFSYRVSRLTINKASVQDEEEKLSIEGSFSPDVEVELVSLAQKTGAFESVGKYMDEELGGSTLFPLQSKMTSYFTLNFSGSVAEGEYQYTVCLDTKPQNTDTLYVRDENGLRKIEEYSLSEDGLSVTFTAGKVDCLVVYSQKDTTEMLKGYLPLAGIALGIMVLITVLSVLLYSAKHRPQKEFYHAERATYHVYPRRRR